MDSDMTPHRLLVALGFIAATMAVLAYVLWLAWRDEDLRDVWHKVLRHRR